MNLNEIKDNNNASKEKKRIGRGIGSGTGKTSGKGHKGQKARSGVSIKGFEGGQMPIHRRLPKRGFTNINRIPYIVLNFDRIENLINDKKIDPNKIINSQTLLDLGIVKTLKSKIKLLAKGEIKAKPVHDWTSHSADSFRYFAVGNQQTTQWTTKIEYPQQGII